MAIKIYLKKGNLNYKERKLVTKIQAVMNEKMLKDPSIESRFQPATNFDELKKLHETYCVEDVEFEEIEGTKDNGNARSQDVEGEDDDNEEMEEEEDEESDNPNDKKADDNSNSAKIQEDPEFQESKTARKMTDPLNREEPKVRSYVLDTDQSSQRETLKTGPERTTFDEPVSFGEAFTIPSDDDEDSGDGKQKQINQDGNKSQGKSSSSETRQQPINPNFDEMSGAKKKKSTKKFAKYIVETVCMLSEKGFEWFANKDINEAKLVEYEVKYEIDLQLLVTLEDGQEATVKVFFQQQCFKAEKLSKIDQEEKEDLIDALADVLLEKGVAPTPSQELMMVGLKIFGGQVLNLIALKSQTNSLLDQLRAMKQADNEFYESAKQTRIREENMDRQATERPVQPQQNQTTQNNNTSSNEKAKVEEPSIEKTESTTSSTGSDELSEYEKSLLDEPLETKE